MALPLSFLAGNTQPEGISLGQYFGDCLSKSSINSLVDCLPSSPKPAIFSPDTTRSPLSHEDLKSFLTNFALPCALNQSPLGPNDRVMTVLPSGPESAVALLAISAYFSCAPINSSCTLLELKEDAIRLRVKAIVTTTDIANRLQLSLQNEIDCQILFLEPRTYGPAGLFDLSNADEKFGNADRMISKTGSVAFSTQPSQHQGLDDISLILHTSGTSGKKKVVRYSLRTLLVGSWCVVHSWGLKSNDINLNMMPLFHVGGIVRNLLAPILSGGSSIMCLGFDPNVFWSLSLDLKATWYYAAPTVHHAILSAQPNEIVPSRDLHIRLVCNAAGGLLPSLAAQIQRVLGAVVLPSYGMTECMPIATPPTDYQLDRPGCSGIACGPYLSIRDPINIERQLPTGATGTVCVRGLPTFDGYEVTADTSVPLDTSVFSKEGWFDSGDMGYMDEDGYLFITGRSKEIINKGGEVISPFEIEEAVVTAAKEYVKTALAFSVEHDVLQETIGVVIVADPARPRLSLLQLHDMLRGHLHPSKWPFVLVYMDAVPKNSTGKPLRIALGKRLGIGQLTNDCPLPQRHLEASLPENQHILSEPIPCSPVSVDLSNVERALRSVEGIRDVSLRSRLDGSTIAYVALSSRTTLRSADIITIIASSLPGYELPDLIYPVDGSLVRDKSGDLDYAAMERVASANAAINLSKTQLLVRDVVAELLNIDMAHINQDSDFFLLGGNSLLLGKLAYQIRKQSGANVGVTDLFSSSTISGIASLIEEADSQESGGDKKKGKESSASSTTAFSPDEYDYDQDLEYARAKRQGTQTHPVVLIVQALPFLFFYPFKAALTWALLLFWLSWFSDFANDGFWKRLATLCAALIVTRLMTRIISPVAAIIFKWAVIGKYRPGTHQMWSAYYLRWWIVNQSLRIAGRGIFTLHPSLTIVYYRLLGAHIGENVHIGDDTRLYECDLLTLHDGCRIDTDTLRGFCVEKEGYFRLEPINIGPKAFVNTYTFISPGTNVPAGSIYGPHASSHDEPSPKSYAAYNRTLQGEPTFLLKLFVAWPIIVITIVISYTPWALAIYAMIKETDLPHQKLNRLETIIDWFATEERVFFHALSRVVRALLRPLLRVAIGIIVKRVLGLAMLDSQLSPNSQRVLLRRYINGVLLSQQSLKDVFSILGSHYEVVSIVYRAMGAKIGRRVYWPGSGVYCPDPELLEIGDDVVFGSRSALFTTDRIGSGKIVVENGAMIADRVVLLPNTRVRIRAVMGSGSLGKRGATYEAGSTWMGNANGEAVCFNRGSKEAEIGDTCTPFGKAFYKRQANYFVFPYPLVVSISIIMTALSAIYWSLSAIAAAQLLRHARIHLAQLRLFDLHWYQLGILYGLVVLLFTFILSSQAIFVILWSILAKWVVIGKRRPGRYDWDQSSYCQRWQLHLVLSRVLYKGFGNGGILGSLTGTAYMVWYFRAFGAKIGQNCAIWAGGETGLMTEPDLVELGDNVSLDDCSVVAHINSRGNFSLNQLKIGNDCAMRSGSRLLSGASMEDNSMLCEHTLLTSGDVADSGQIYSGWPAKPLRDDIDNGSDDEISALSPIYLTCPVCSRFPKDSTIGPCGHLFCQGCISRALSVRKCCPVCFDPFTARQLKKVHPSFVAGAPAARTN